MSEHVQTLAERPNAYLRLVDAAKLWPGSAHPATLTRHILRGVRLKDGTTLRLDARRTPGGWVVSREAIDAFIDALTADRCGQSTAVTYPTPAARRRAVERAEAELDALGV